jgi:hypothetical protein
MGCKRDHRTEVEIQTPDGGFPLIKTSELCT